MKTKTAVEVFRDCVDKLKGKKLGEKYIEFFGIYIYDPEGDRYEIKIPEKPLCYFPARENEIEKFFSRLEKHHRLMKPGGGWLQPDIEIDSWLNSDDWERILKPVIKNIKDDSCYNAIVMDVINGEEFILREDSTSFKYNAFSVDHKIHSFTFYSKDHNILKISVDFYFCGENRGLDYEVPVENFDLKKEIESFKQKSLQVIPEEYSEEWEQVLEEVFADAKIPEEPEIDLNSSESREKIEFINFLQKFGYKDAQKFSVSKSETGELVGWFDEFKLPEGHELIFVTRDPEGLGWNLESAYTPEEKIDFYNNQFYMSDGILKF